MAIVVNPATACRVLATTVLPAATIAAHRATVRGLLFDRFPALGAALRRPEDAVAAYVGADVARAPEFEYDAEGEARFRSRAMGEGSEDEPDRAAPPPAEVTRDAATALIKLYDAVVFGGSLSASFVARDWTLELAAADAPRDVVRVIQTPRGDKAVRVPVRARGVEIKISVRTPGTYCFKHAAAPPLIFGVPCRDALDCIMVQVEHQLVHAALLVGGCADADPTVAAALEAAAAARSPAALAVVLDSLPHSELMATATAGLFGHMTPLHGPYVWSVPPGPIVAGELGTPLGTPPCCMRPLPADARRVVTPTHEIESLWAARSLARATLRRTRVLPAVAFDPRVGAWTAGWRVARVGRWYMELVADPACGGAMAAPGSLLRVPIPFVRPFLTLDAEWRLPDTRVEGGFWSTLAYNTPVFVLPEPEVDLARTSAADEDDRSGSLSGSKAEAGSRRATYTDSLVEGLPLATYMGPADRYGRVVKLADGSTIEAERILPIAAVAEDARAPA